MRIRISLHELSVLVSEGRQRNPSTGACRRTIRGPIEHHSLLRRCRLYAIHFLPRYTASVTGSPCDVLLSPIVMNIIVKFSFGAAPCQ